MLTLHRPMSDHHDQEEDHEHVRDVHALTPPHPSPAIRGASGSRWETSSHRSSASNVSSTELGSASTENFTTMSREFNALVIAGSSMDNNHGTDTGNHLSRIGEDDLEETNPLAIVPDNNYNPGPEHRRVGSGLLASDGGGGGHGEVSLQRVKKEEVESKITAWQNAKIAKINNRLKREDAVLNGWESEQVQRATSWMKKIERKLEEKRARALEKMQNDVAKARRKAEEKRASAEAKRGTKVARVLEIANLMRAVGRPPAKRSFF